MTTFSVNMYLLLISNASYFRENITDDNLYKILKK